jgi:hypothetical protein
MDIYYSRHTEILSLRDHLQVYILMFKKIQNLFTKIQIDEGYKMSFCDVNVIAYDVLED